MSTTDMSTTTLDQRVVEATIGALELFGIFLGDRLGLYEALRQRGASTAAELAEAAGIAPRYAREWLEQQAVAGVLIFDDANADAEARRYTLPEAHVGVVADPVALDHVAPLARLVVGIAGVLDDVIDAYRSGGGVPYSRYGSDFRGGQGAINRPVFTSALVEEWLPALGAPAERLASGGRLADLGCGQGWSALAVARAYPSAEVVGVDSDPSSIADARAAAAEQGVGVRFECVDGTEIANLGPAGPGGEAANEAVTGPAGPGGEAANEAVTGPAGPGGGAANEAVTGPAGPGGGAANEAVTGPFDVVLLLEALHDLARPVEILAAARAALAADGAMLVADEAVASTFTAPGDEIERMMYGWSITHCLPASMVEQPSAAIGTVIRESTVRALAEEAGFGAVDVLDVDGGFFRLYALRP